MILMRFLMLTVRFSGVLIGLARQIRVKELVYLSSDNKTIITEIRIFE